MSARHILFVETEGDSLKRLMKALADEQQGWHIVRVAEAEAALEMLSQRLFCVVMASFGGKHEACEQFMREVQRRAPAVIRFALLPDAAQADQSTDLEAAMQSFSSNLRSHSPSFLPNVRRQL